MTKNIKSLFISHGGGPLPLLGDNGHTEMIEVLQKIAATIQKPNAIVLISAHWEESLLAMTAAAKPELIYDYYGFPEESYQIQYPAAGSPELAGKIAGLCQQQGIESRLVQDRGFDHGMFIPLKIMYPHADIPTVQLALLNSLDPKQHIQIGNALQSLPADNVLVIGSGFSFHNMQAFFGTVTAEKKSLNHQFEDWLIDVCSNENYSEAERQDKLIHWEHAPGARYCHPREEHLLPLHACYGVAQAACSDYYELDILGKKSSMYLW